MTRLSPFSVPAQPGRVHLRLVETTDLHMHIAPYDYFTDRPAPRAGLSAAAPLIWRLRHEAPNSLLLDNGDLLQGTPMGDCAAADCLSEPDRPHPAIAALNALGVDAATVGNHDFNFGLDVLLSAMGAARYPVVLANVARRLGDAPEADDMLFPPYALLDRDVTDATGTVHRLTIGVIGFVPPQIMVWDQTALKGHVAVRGIVEAAQTWVQRMRAAGADLVIALSHAGMEDVPPHPGQENASAGLAALDGIDAVLMGHAHRLFPGPFYADLPSVDMQAGTVHGTAAVMGGVWGQHLGVIDLDLALGPDGWRVAGSRSATPAVVDAGDNDTLLGALLERSHARTLAYIRRPIGHSKVPLQTHTALVGACPALQIVADAQAWFARDVLRDGPLSRLPLISAAPPFKAGGRGGADHYVDIPAGDLLLKHAADLYPYPNTLRILRIRGADLRLWLERIAGAFSQITPGMRDAPLLDPAFPAYHFDLPHGLTWQFDLTQPALYAPEGTLRDTGGRRVLDVRHAGTPLQDAQEFLVVTNDYRAAGGGHFPGCTPNAVVYESPVTNRDVLLQFLSAAGPYTAPPCNLWDIAPISGATALFSAGPGAQEHLSGLPHRQIECVSTNTEGAAQYRIDLHPAHQRAPRNAAGVSGLAQ